MGSRGCKALTKAIIEGGSGFKNVTYLNLAGMVRD